MMGVFQIFVLLLLVVPYEEISALPFKKGTLAEGSTQNFEFYVPNAINGRQRRADEEQSGNSGMQEFITTAIKDGIAASAALDSPTMFIGGFSVMMQPMPNGTEFAGQLMQMAPHYLNAISGIGRK